MTDSPFGPVRKWGNEPRCFLSDSDYERLDEAAQQLAFDRHSEAAIAVTKPTNLKPLTEAEAFPDQRDAGDVVWILALLIAMFLAANVGLLAAWFVLGWWGCGVIFGLWWVGIAAVGAVMWRAK